MEPFTDADIDADERHLPPEARLITVTIDGAEKQITRGRYVVSKLKEVLGVPADYELDIVIRGEFRHLADDAEIRVFNHEVFVSHVRSGSSS